MVAVDFGDIPPADARRVPLTSWFRFRRVVENTSTVLLVLEQEPYARSCASLVLRLDARLSASSSCEGHQPSAISRQPDLQFVIGNLQSGPAANRNHHLQITNRKSPVSHTQLLTGLDINVELLRAPAQNKKPAGSATASVESQSAWKIG